MYSMRLNKRDVWQVFPKFLERLFVCAMNLNFKLIFSPLVKIGLLYPTQKVFPVIVITYGEKRPLWTFIKKLKSSKWNYMELSKFC